MIEKERETIEAIARNEGRPEAQLDKIVEGRLTGWFKDRVLLDQPFARDDKQSVAQILKGAEVHRFAQVVVGVSDGAASGPGGPKRARSAIATLEACRLEAVWRGTRLVASDETIDAAVVRQIAKEIAESVHRPRRRACRDDRRRQHLARPNRRG